MRKSMMIEERIEKLEMENQALKDRIAALENNRTPQYVTIGELAEIMQCSRQNIYQKIRTGNILATRKLGDPRIPMNQFLEDAQEAKVDSSRKPKVTREKTMAELVFGT